MQMHVKAHRAADGSAGRMFAMRTRVWIPAPMNMLGRNSGPSLIQGSGGRDRGSLGQAGCLDSPYQPTLGSSRDPVSIYIR